MPDTATMEAIVSLCKRRGFIFPASEIYGGLNGFWDYGPLGAALKRNLKNAWWEDVVEREHHALQVRLYRSMVRMTLSVLR